MLEHIKVTKSKRPIRKILCKQKVSRLPEFAQKSHSVFKMNSAISKFC